MHEIAVANNIFLMKWWFVFVGLLINYLHTIQVRRQEKKLSGNIRNAVKNKREEDIKALKLQKQVI